jgi:hypothetical protein
LGIPDSLVEKAGFASRNSAPDRKRGAEVFLVFAKNRVHIYNPKYVVMKKTTKRESNKNQMVIVI